MECIRYDSWLEWLLDVAGRDAAYCDPFKGGAGGFSDEYDRVD